MKQLIQKLLGQFGYGFRRLSKLKAFVPFVRDFHHPEASFRMWIANPEDVTWYDEEHWRKAGEFRALRKLVGAGDRILEIGSHHGFTGMLLARFVGAKGQILSIEAHPQNAMIAHAQLGLNASFTNLTFIHAAGSNVPGTVKIIPLHNSNVTNQTADDLIEVPAVTGDMLDLEQGPFDLIKIDVEGYELEVLKGCRQMLSRAPKLALEIHVDSLRERGQTPADIFRLIDVNRYKGEMVVRPEQFETVQVFDPSAFPERGVVNVFLESKQC